MMSQIKGDYLAKESIFQKYLAKIKERLEGLSRFEIQYIPREQNHQADLLSKLANTKPTGNTQSLVKEMLPNSCVILQIDSDD